MNDIQQRPAKASGTVVELREFLAQARGKSPQEVLGMVAQSGLFASTLISAGCILVLLVVMTVIPYALSDRNGDPANATGGESAAAEEGSDPSVANEPADADNEQDTSDTSPTGDDAIDALGIGEAKQADRATNPLENELDNLLDKID